jgi:hypothetical protein
MIGLRLPLIYRHTQVETEVKVSDEYAGLARSADHQTQSQLDPREMSLRAREALDRKLERYDYEPLENDQREWTLGDVELLSKVLLWQNVDHVFSLRQRVALPTASSKSPYRYVNTQEADGQLDLGADIMWDYWLGRGWLASFTGGYTWQTPDQIPVRVPAANEGVSGDVDLEVNRDLGDYWSASFYAEHSLAAHWNILGGYSFRKKARDTYDGGGFESDRYQALSRASRQEFHMAHAGLTYRADPFSRRHGVSNQFSTSLYLSTVLAGSNIPDSQLAGMDLQLLF